MSDDERFAELRRFLKERRARILPAEVGLPARGRRRVPGLRREEVATLAGIGVSWYTALENGTARSVSEATLQAVAGALRLSDSERQYMFALAGAAQPTDGPGAAGELAVATLHAIVFPAYIITAAWDALECNAAFARVWAIGDDERTFNVFERLFIDPRARAMHGPHFETNVRPVIAMLHSSLGRHPAAQPLQRLHERILADAALAPIWNEYEISSPLLSNACTIASPLGPFHYETITLPIGDGLGIVVQVPDAASRARL